MNVDPADLLRFLARWDRDEAVLRHALGELAGRPVHFSRAAAPRDRGALFALFDRDPLDAVSTGPDGSWMLPYDPWTAWRSVVEERWLGSPRAPLHARLPLPYQLVPGALRLLLYPAVAGRPAIGPEDCPPEPAWPIEPRIDRFRTTLWRGIHEERGAAGAAAATRAAAATTRGAAANDRTPPGPWPGGRRYPLLVTFDVDTKAGLPIAAKLLDEMLDLGVKPCFFLVGRGYRVDDGFCDAVRQAGGEIALHGDVHDNRIAYTSADEAGKRLDRCRAFMERHRVVGFRSPSLLVSDALYAALGPRFAWDSSVPDTDTHTLLGPRRGCATVFPFRRGETLVLPLTVPADDRLLLLGYAGLEMLGVLRRKCAYLREVSGLCHLLVHPEPHLFGRPVVRDLFRALLQELLDEGSAWVTTPSQVAAFWRSLESQGAAA
jgi:peptidoglycan/xylan/chitin deacetylase (PgdA/CDA1 family)